MKEPHKEIQDAIALIKKKTTSHQFMFNDAGELIGGLYVMDGIGMYDAEYNFLRYRGLDPETLEFILHTTQKERAELKRLARIAALKRELRDLEELTPNGKQP